MLRTTGSDTLLLGIFMTTVVFPEVTVVVAIGSQDEEEDLDSLSLILTSTSASEEAPTPSSLGMGSRSVPGIGWMYLTWFSQYSLFPNLNPQTWQWWNSLRSWFVRCQRRFFLSPKVRWHLEHLKGRSLLCTTLMCRSKSPRRVNRASQRSHAWGRSWAWVFKWAFREPGFMIRWQDRHSILAPSPSPTTMVLTWILPSPSSSISSKSSAF